MPETVVDRAFQRFERVHAQFLPLIVSLELGLYVLPAAKGVGHEWAQRNTNNTRICLRQNKATDNTDKHGLSYFPQEVY